MNAALCGEWGNPPDDVDTCVDCGVDEDFDRELCRHGRCGSCECEDCYVERDMARQQAVKDRAGRAEARLEDIGRDRYYEAKYGNPC